MKVGRGAIRCRVDFMMGKSFLCTFVLKKGVADEIRVHIGMDLNFRCQKAVI